MTEELILELCPFCGGPACYCLPSGIASYYPTDLVSCENGTCMGYKSLVPLPKWQSRPLETAAYVKGLQRAVEIANNASSFTLLSQLESEIQEAQG